MFKVDFQEIDLGTGSQALVATIQGAVDTQTVGKLEKTITQKFQEGHKFQLLDFAQVKYINSTGMGTLVKVSDIFQQQGGHCVLINVNPKVKELFSMLGLLSVLKIYDSLEEGLSYLTGMAGASIPQPEVSVAPKSSAPAAKAKPAFLASAVSSASTPSRPSPGPAKPSSPGPPLSLENLKPESKKLDDGLELEILPQKLSDGGNAYLIRIKGALDTRTILPFEKEIKRLVQLSNRIMLDFSEVKYINSTGMGTLVKLGDEIRAGGGEVVLLQLNQKIHELLGMLGLLAVLKIAKDETAAKEQLVAAASSSPPSPSPKPTPPSAPKTESPSPAPPKEVPVLKGAKNIQFSVEALPLSPQHRALLIGVQGALDASTIRIFEQAITDLHQKGDLYQILDFSEVKYINSTGMGTLVKLGDNLRASKGDLILIHVNEKVKELFNMLGLLPVIKIKSTEEEAISLFQELLGLEKKAGSSSSSSSPTSADSTPMLPGQSAPTGGTEATMEFSLEEKRMQLIQEGNDFEKKGLYKEAIEKWSEAMALAEFKTGLKNKIERAKAKLAERASSPDSLKPAPSPSAAEDDLDAEMQELSREIAHTSPTPTPTTPKSEPIHSVDDMDNSIFGEEPTTPSPLDSATAFNIDDDIFSDRPASTPPASTPPASSPPPTGLEGLETMAISPDEIAAASAPPASTPPASSPPPTGLEGLETMAISPD
ncbi:MAG: anti-sigma factor antagonist, partial [Planctomycetota bacterium]